MTSTPARTTRRDTHHAARPDTRWLLAVALITLAAAALRLYQIGVESYWVDELIMIEVTSYRTPVLLRELYQTARAPLYPLLGHFWQLIFGSSQGAVRAMSALFGTVSVPLVALLGRKLFDRRTGTIAAALMALSVFQVYFGQEHRYYSLAILLTLAAVWFFLNALETHKPRDYALYALFTALHFYTHPLSAALFAGSMGLYLLVRWAQTREHLRAWIITHVGMGLAVLPTVALRLVRSAQNSVDSQYFGSGGLTPDWLDRPPLWEPVRTLVNFLFLGQRYLLLIPALVVLALFAVGLLVIVLRRGIRPWLADIRALPGAPREWPQSTLFTLIWFAAPVVVSYLVTFTVLPVYYERYLSLSAPAMYLLIAAALVRLRPAVPDWLSTGLIALWLVIALQQYYVRDIKEQWDEAAAAVETQAQPGDALAFSSNIADDPARATGVRVSFNWYYDGDLPQCEIDVMQDRAAVIDQLQSCAGPSGRVWLLVRFSEDARVEAVGEAIRQQTPGADGLLESRWFVGDMGLYLLDVS